MSTDTNQTPYLSTPILVTRDQLEQIREQVGYENARTVAAWHQAPLMAPYTGPAIGSVDDVKDLPIVGATGNLRGPKRMLVLAPDESYWKAIRADTCEDKRPTPTRGGESDRVTITISSGCHGSSREEVGNALRRLIRESERSGGSTRA